MHPKNLPHGGHHVIILCNEMVCLLASLSFKSESVLYEESRPELHYLFITQMAKTMSQLDRRRCSYHFMDTLGSRTHSKQVCVSFV